MKFSLNKNKIDFNKKNRFIDSDKIGIVSIGVLLKYGQKIFLSKLIPK